MDTLSPARLTTPGHPQRLALFRLSMPRYPDRVPAGELAAVSGLTPKPKPNGCRCDPQP